jgi:hypothetical protein
MATTCDYQVIGFDDDLNRLTIKYRSGDRVSVLSLTYDGTENIDAFALRCAPWALFKEPAAPATDNSGLLGKRGTVTEPEQATPPQAAGGAPAA